MCGVCMGGGYRPTFFPERLHTSTFGLRCFPLFFSFLSFFALGSICCLGTRHNDNPSNVYQHLPPTEVHKALFCLLFMLGCSCPHRWITVPARIMFMLGCSCPHRWITVPVRIVFMLGCSCPYRWIIVPARI